MLKATYVGRFGRMVALGQTFERGVAVEVDEAMASFLRRLDPIEYPVDIEEEQSPSRGRWPSLVVPTAGEDEETEDEPEGDTDGVTEEDSNG